MAGEFEIIERYFAPLAGPAGLGLKDDAALMKAPDDMSLVMTKDISVAGVHFPHTLSADATGWRVLAVNLSDLAAKGARPLGYLLGLGLTGREDENWLAAFAAGLGKAQLFGRCQLLGGDTVRTGERLTVSISAIGAVPDGQFVPRNKASAGDVVYVTGTLGDASLGLACMQGTLMSDDYLIERFSYPRPRVSMVPVLREFASAAVDISDGLMADAGHIADTSQVAVKLEQARLPLSDSARSVLSHHPDEWPKIWSGGDDYEILCTIRPASVQAFEKKAAEAGVPVTAIGTVTAGKGVFLHDLDGQPVARGNLGFQHF